MAKKKKTEKPVEEMDPNTHILGAGDVLRQNITETLETNLPQKAALYDV